MVRRTAEQVFIPLTVGGGVRTADDVDALLRAGADKVGVNTAAIARPEFLREVAHRFGSQCIVLSVDARRCRRSTPSGFEVTTHGGRRGTGIDAVEWAGRGAELGAGEILLNSMDADGTKAGFDLRDDRGGPRGRRRAGDRQRRRGRGSATSRRRSRPAPTRCSRRASSTSASCGSARSRPPLGRRPGTRSADTRPPQRQLGPSEARVEAEPSGARADAASSPVRSTRAARCRPEVNRPARPGRR